jgi:hypothetical protein
MGPVPHVQHVAVLPSVAAPPGIAAPPGTVGALGGLPAPAVSPPPAPLPTLVVGTVLPDPVQEAPAAPSQGEGPSKEAGGVAMPMQSEDRMGDDEDVDGGKGQGQGPAEVRGEGEAEAEPEPEAGGSGTPSGPGTGDGADACSAVPPADPGSEVPMPLPLPEAATAAFAPWEGSLPLAPADPGAGDCDMGVPGPDTHAAALPADPAMDVSGVEVPPTPL